MNYARLFLGAAFAAFLLPAQADEPSDPTACGAEVGDTASRAITWLEDRVAALKQLENPTEQDAALLKEYEMRLSGLSQPEEDDDSVRCTPGMPDDNGDRVS